MVNPFDNIKKNAKKTKAKSQWEGARESAEIESRDCPQCGATRPKETDLRSCAYCGFTFMDLDAPLKVDERPYE